MNLALIAADLPAGSQGNFSIGSVVFLLAMLAVAALAAVAIFLERRRQGRDDHPAE